jgi:hypothetical protein
VVSTGGQYWTQLVLLQLDVAPLSARKRYTVCPFESTRTWPTFVVPTLIAVPDATGGTGEGLAATTGAALGEAGVEPYRPDPPPVPDEQAAAMNPAATRPLVRTSFECMSVLLL